MVVQSKPVPINQTREPGYHRRNYRYSAQRIQNQIQQPLYPSPPYESPPQMVSVGPHGDFQGIPASPPTQSHTQGFFPGPAPFPTGVLVPGNYNTMAQNGQYVDLQSETPSPPAGFSATTMHGPAGPPYAMPLRNEFSPSLNAQSDGIFNSSPPQCDEVGERQVMYQQQMLTTQVRAFWPPNMCSPPPPFRLIFVPSPPPMPTVTCDANCGCRFPPPPQQGNLPLLRPMPSGPYYENLANSGAMPEVVEPPPMQAPDNNGRSHWVKNRRRQGKSTNVASDYQVVKMSEQENWRLEIRQRSSSAPAITSPFCSFCKSNRETRQFYESHVLKNDNGVTTCPVLRKYTCPICKAVGDNAHTLKYCPENQDSILNSRERSMSLSSQKSALKKKRNSRGIIGAYRYG